MAKTNMEREFSNWNIIKTALQKIIRTKSYLKKNSKGPEMDDFNFETTFANSCNNKNRQHKLGNLYEK